MVYADHKFYHNFCNAVGGDDDSMQKDIIVTEVTKIIADDTAAFINVVIKSGIPLSNKRDFKTLINIFVENTGNKNFQENLSKLILESNKIPVDAKLKIVMADSNKASGLLGNGKTTETLTPQSKDAVASISNAISLISSKEEKDEIKKQMLSGINTEETVKPKSIAFGLTVVAIIGLSIYAYLKYKK